MANQPQRHRITLASLGIALSLFCLLSLFSFSVEDWPNPDVSASLSQIHNLCGPIGAFLAYYCFYYLGPAAILLVIAMIVGCVFFCRGRKPDQPVLRSIGILLLAAVFSGAAHLINPGDADSLSIGNGGILGVALGHFLLSQTAMTGAVLILTATMIVGLLLAADDLLLKAPGVLLLIARRFRAIMPNPALVGAAAGRVSARLPELRPRPTGTKSKSKKENRFTDDQAESEELPLFESETEGDQEETESIRETTENAEASEKPREKSFTAVSNALARLRGKSPAPTSKQHQEPDLSGYQYPPLDILAQPHRGYAALQEKVVREKGRILSETLREFNINANVVEAETGPVITLFELELAPGIKVAQISNLANDLARSLGAASVRVVAPLPGRHTIGIEVPNSEKEKVRVRELMDMGAEKASKMHIPLFLGKDASGDPLIADLTQMPHLLIAGTTGSGKSVCINSIIISILLTQRPDLVKLILVDPKMVEMNAFRDVPHLMCPIVTEMKRAEQILEWLTTKMDERYAVLAEAGVRNIANFNKLTEQEIYERFQPSNEEEKAKIPLKMPYLVVIIDELADLMMTSAKEVEAYIIRLAQKSRAVGIHIVLATQRPQATVVTGLIKSNLPCRISFRVAARMDSRIVLDQNGAEVLLGQGDMLFLQPGTSDLIRAQGTFVADGEINGIVGFLRDVAQPSFHPELVQLNTLSGNTGERDELFDEAVKVILETQRGSVSLLQRRLTIGYSRASRLVDQMAAAGIVGDYKGSQAREVLLTLEEYEQIKRQMERDAVMGYGDLQEEQEPSDAEVADEAECEEDAVPEDVEETETEEDAEQDEDEEWEDVEKQEEEDEEKDEEEDEEEDSLK